MRSKISHATPYVTEGDIRFDGQSEKQLKVGESSVVSHSTRNRFEQ